MSQQDKKVSNPTRSHVARTPGAKGVWYFRFFHRWGLWRQILVVISLVTVVFGYAAGEYVRNTEQTHLLSQYQTQNHRTSQILTATALDAVITQDLPVLQTVVEEAGKSDPAIFSLRILDEAGKPLVQWRQSGNTSPENTISFASNVVLEGETFGRLEITWNTDAAYLNIENHVDLIRLTVVLAIIIMTLIIIGLIQALVVGPVENINSRLTGGMSRRKVLSGITLPSFTAKELVRLNDSVSALEKEWERTKVQEVELRHARDGLEEKVKERTGKLEATNKDLKREIGERERAEYELKITQAQLIHASKMESLGTLAGGIAHEINTPAQFIGNNLKFLKGAVADVQELLDAYEDLVLKIGGEDLLKQEREALGAARERLDIEFLNEEMPSAAAQALDGVSQISSIVLAMKEFAHPSKKEMRPVDINALLQRASTISRGEWKHAGRLELKLDPSLPKALGQEDELNQVFLNLIINASQAIEEGGGKEGKIIITSSVHEDSVRIIVSDNGPGIPEDIRERIFDPFFTTKSVGKGSGQGLAIAYDIIVKKHGGALELVSDMGEGSTFNIELPVADK